LENGKCERCGSVVEKKPLRQWVLRITDYADRMLADLEAKFTNGTIVRVASENVPVFEQVGEPGAIKQDLPFKERLAITAIVKHWSEDKYLGLKWKKVPWQTFITGGIEKGQTAEEAAIAEVVEETGYKNLRLVKNLGKVDSKFYHVPKQENRFAHFDVLYFELEDDERVETSEKEKAIHDVMWVPKEEVGEFITPESQKYMWSLFLGQSQTYLEGIKPLLDWPRSIKESQKNWIGRSEGINFTEKVKDLDIKFEVYDSIPQTFLAQTFTIIAPEHPLVKVLVEGTPQEKEILEFVDQIAKKKLVNKFDVENDMEGIFTGRYVDNPFGTGDLPIWVASYVVADYGTGIVNCSAHDERDFAFAKKYNIPLKIALLPRDQGLAEKVRNLEVFYREPDGIIQLPAEFAGLNWTESRDKIIDFISTKGYGKKATHYKLRDWVFSRQRYWGEPIPMIHCAACGVVPVPEKDLPVRLPEVEHYEPTGTGESPLANIAEWVNVPCPKCGGAAKRETNTMPQWAGSSWYYLRYIDPKNNQTLVDKTKEKYWSPVDFYVGGAEHATRHLIYARFWHKFLFDIGVVNYPEPFKRLQNVGLIMAEDGRKMSKRYGNVINPDDIVKLYGADTLRVYEMFMGPFDQSIAWSTESMMGPRRFLERVWKLHEKTNSRSVLENPSLTSLLHQTIKKVGEDIEAMRFNTAISAMMILVNAMESSEKVSQKDYESLLLILAPFAPHITEELWHELGQVDSIHQSAWPEYKESELGKTEWLIIVQVNGVKRDSLVVAAGKEQSEVENMALNMPKIAKWLEGKEVKKIIYVSGKLVNIVV
jgi:leucyl-tRNA synthetase